MNRLPPIVGGSNRADFVREIDMHIQQLFPTLAVKLAINKTNYTAKIIPAEDESVDDEIELRLAGAPTGLTIQVGYGYAGLNESVIENGEFTGILSHKYWDLPTADKVANDVVKFLMDRKAVVS